MSELSSVRIELSAEVLRLEVNGTSYGPGPVVLVSTSPGEATSD